jgi:two-component system sensor histidine kinase DevS
MFRTRPPWFAVVCIGIWLLQFMLMAVAFRWVGSAGASTQRWWQLAAAGATGGLGAMLLVQLPRAMQWRPRIGQRPSAEVLAQRRRIARDLHDYVGSQLVFALVLLESSRVRAPEVHAALEKCLLDLRMVVDSMDAGDAPLADQLAQLRYRVGPVLAQRGIRTVWEVEAPQIAELPHADSATHLVAIFQEALSNALQHAQATEIEVRATHLSEPAAWCIEIRDNGQGIVPPPVLQGAVGTGSGLAGMARRATLAGGELQVFQREQGGTCIRVTVPLARRP